MRERLCLNCGEPGHFGRNCPHREGKDGVTLKGTSSEPCTCENCSDFNTEVLTEESVQGRASFTYGDDQEVDMQLFFETEEETTDEQIPVMGNGNST